MTEHNAPLGGRYFTLVTLFLAALMGVAGYFLAQRFIHGIGAVTNLNDGYTWGIWIAYDVVIGTAFACGGYAMALLVYVFNRGQYHPLVRPALLASLFGYSLGGVSVIFDLGRWWNMWHIYWPGYAQPNSVMFEVAACIGAYCVVLWIEFAPAMLERFGLKRLKRVLNRLLFVFIALGVLLPSMHQSSLGTLLVVFGYMVHPLWQTDLLPLLFLTSAITMGLSIVVFEASLSAAGFKRPQETSLLGKMSATIVGLLIAYLALRFGDLWWRDQLHRAIAGDVLSRLFWVEIGLFLLPVLILSNPAHRRNARMLFLAAVAMLLAGSLYRLDAFLIAFDPNTNPGDNWTYFPSVPEMMVTFGVIATEILAYIVFARFFPVMHKVEQPNTVAAE